MQELINELQSKAGLTSEQAQQAVSVMTNFVKSKLPDGLAGKVEDLMSGNFNLGNLFGGNNDQGGSAFDALSNMFGGDK